ncbi:MAG: hypothetical protein AAB955_02985 [Patescibacteria group bacterium]
MLEGRSQPAPLWGVLAVYATVAALALGTGYLFYEKQYILGSAAAIFTSAAGYVSISSIHKIRKGY